MGPRAGVDLQAEKCYVPAAAKEDNRVVKFAFIGSPALETQHLGTYAEAHRTVVHDYWPPAYGEPIMRELEKPHGALNIRESNHGSCHAAAGASHYRGVLR